METPREITKAHLAILEYEQLKDEQRRRIGFRDNLLYATLGSIAVVIAAVLQARSQANLLLILPPVALILGWTYLVNDQKISAIGRYVAKELAPPLEAECGSPNVFAWETAHRSDPQRLPRKYIQLIVDIGLFCVASVAAISIYVINGPLEWRFIIVAVLELLASLGLAQQIVLYADLHKGSHK